MIERVTLAKWLFSIDALLGILAIGGTAISGACIWLWRSRAATA